MSNDLFEIIEENPDVTESDIRPRTVAANDYSVFMTEFHSGPRVGSQDETGRTGTHTVDVPDGVRDGSPALTVDSPEGVRDAPTVDSSRGVRGTFFTDGRQLGNLVDYTDGAMGLHMPYEERLVEFHETLPADYEPPALISMERWPTCFNYRLFPYADDLITIEIRRQLVVEIVDMLYEMLDDSVRRTGTPENAEDPSISERVQPDVYTRNSVTLFPELAWHQASE